MKTRVLVGIATLLALLAACFLQVKHEATVRVGNVPTRTVTPTLTATPQRR